MAASGMRSGRWIRTRSRYRRLLCWTIPCAKLPRNRSPAAVSRRDPSTIRSAFHFSAALTIFRHRVQCRSVDSFLDADFGHW